MWTQGWRENVWNEIEQGNPWDIIVIGGGIVGAGILREAVRLGKRVLLVEQRDFAWGTSSRSSKFIHGGLRYLKQGDIRLIWESVTEREHLMNEAPGLIQPMRFVVPTSKGDHVDWLTKSAAFAIYDALAWHWNHRFFKTSQFKFIAPHMAHSKFSGAFNYGDAQTDDARLVLRVIEEAVEEGGFALNYARVDSLLRDGDNVIGVRLSDMAGDRTFEVRANVVINATGAWADNLRKQLDAPEKLRPLRGSHIVFPAWRFPVGQTISFEHPVDKRFIFVVPWEGVTMVGTTDVDHQEELNLEPRISPDEVAYLMATLDYAFPSLNLTLDDVISTFAGVRSVINTGKDNPSAEPRDHMVMYEDGLLTVTGGKLTTFRLIAHGALKAIPRERLELSDLDSDLPLFSPVEIELHEVDLAYRQRLIGRYGKHAQELVIAAQDDELTVIPGTNILWAELRWAARQGGVVHLDDLLLRRVRLGLLVAEGGAAYMDRIRAICQSELGWDDARWQAEETAYRNLWKQHYSLPERELIPDWRANPIAKPEKKSKSGKKRMIAAAVATGSMALLVGSKLWRKNAVESE